MIPLAVALPSGRVARVIARADAAGRVYAFDPNQPRDEDGRWMNTAGGRVARALASHQPATAAKQRMAAVQEGVIARMLRARQSGDNDPMDVVGTVRAMGRKFGVEVKTLIDNRNDKITMHPESLQRKLAWALREKASLHTVVVDKRLGRMQELYYRRGVGSFRLAALTSVRDAAHLRTLVEGAG